MIMHIKYHRGFSLVEVLFAIFILSVGVLGIFALQMFAKQNNYDAIQRTTAANLATNIIERMRMNAAARSQYIQSAEPVPTNSVLPTASCLPGTPCTPPQVAQRDLLAWYALIEGVTELNSNGTNSGGLLAPSACITSTGVNQYRIVITWRGRTALSNPTVSPCGSGTGLYGANNEFRRLYYIDATIE